MSELLPLIQTKLYRPPLQANLVHRPRLYDRLDSHWKLRPLTLISAPAGYGKSVLASMWLETCDCPSGWVSLDERDNDLSTFTAYLLAAVKTAFPDISLPSQALLETPTHTKLFNNTDRRKSNDRFNRMEVQQFYRCR